jgi:hypothetical protein
MSLKAFHIVFISVSVLTAFGFAAWLFNGYSKSDASGQLVAGMFSILAGLGLIVYGIRFLRNLKHVSFL